MANPNIVSVSSIYFQNAGFNLQATAEAVITVAADKTLKINSIYVCNTQPTDEVVTITFASIGVLTGVVHNNDATATPSLLNEVSVPADTTIQVIDNPIYLVENDTMSAFGGASDDDLKLFASWEAFNDA